MENTKEKKEWVNPEIINISVNGGFPAIAVESAYAYNPS